MQTRIPTRRGRPWMRRLAGLAAVGFLTGLAAASPVHAQCSVSGGGGGGGGTTGGGGAVAGASIGGGGGFGGRGGGGGAGGAAGNVAGLANIMQMAQMAQQVDAMQCDLAMRQYAMQVREMQSQQRIVETATPQPMTATEYAAKKQQKASARKQLLADRQAAFAARANRRDKTL